MKNFTDLYFRKEAKWFEDEEKFRQTCAGKTKLVILTIGLHPFFDNLMSGVMLSISLSLNTNDCDMGILNWFLAGGVVLFLNYVLADVTERIEEMAEKDGRVSMMEHRFIETLGFFKFFVFITELVIFLFLRLVDVSFGHRPQSSMLKMFFKL